MKSAQSWAAFFVFVLGFLSATVLELPELKAKVATVFPGFASRTERRHIYTTQMLFRNPLMLYIDDFVDQNEIAELLEIGSTLFEPSTIGGGKVSKQRTSNSCFLRGNDSVILRVRERVAHFMGAIPFDGIETPQLVRYQDDQTFNLHMDWFREPIEDLDGHTYNRLASFFIYLDANCTSGETWFPELPSLVSPGESSEKFSNPEGKDGLAIVPRAGSGVFWMNLDENGVGNERTLHAGLPVSSGSKVGMNLWVKKFV